MDRELVYENDKTYWYRDFNTKRVDKYMREPSSKGFKTEDYKAFLVEFKDTGEEEYIFLTKDQQVIECRSLRHMEDLAFYFKVGDYEYWDHVLKRVIESLESEVYNF